MDLTPLARVLAELDQKIVCAYLYGSRARGDARPTSDVDVAILLNLPPPATLDGLRFDIASILEDTLGKPVDLLVLNTAPVDLVHRVLRDGILVHDRDCAARIRFEVKARNEYFDLLPVLERYRHRDRGRAA
ncbi:MAG: nucleotidyltransferase domain-containing protein [Gammaproteobacteria bacterium]|nr:nucleotidyltransferase domain-containing protein [Gammaproteobacteria bacterium]